MVSPALLPNTASSIVDQNGRATQEFRDFLIRLGAASDGDLLQHEIDALAVRVAALENSPAIDAIILGLYSVQAFGTLASGQVMIYLQNDTDNLGPTMVYGTDEESSRAWLRVFDMLAAGAGIEITDSGYRVLGVVETSADIPGTGVVGDAYRVLELSEAGLWAWDGAAWVLDAAADGVVGVQLVPLANTGVGVSPVKIYTRDAYGRIEGDEDADTDDLPEGATNLYFTAARVRATVLTGLSLASSAVIAATDTVLSALGKLQAQITAIADIITQTITDGDTTHAPSGDAVFDALALLADGGTYIPAATAVTNVSATTPFECFFQRVNNTVEVSGAVNVTAAASSGVVEFTLSIPVPSNFTSAVHAAGTASFFTPSEIVPATIIAGTDDTMRVRFYAESTTIRLLSFTAMYRIL